jgi:glutamine synthetase type III
MQGASSITGLGKEQRFFALNEQRKVKREDLLMKRRGLNFVTEHHEELLEQTVIQACEQQLDNVAPKVVALLSLGADCNT